ncbi:MAG: hypothetical protein K2X97_12635, partial [Mycobacteriaceae bacterium]|nr:hypothetical protein [Mycobacteriaceae bacterium]
MHEQRNWTRRACPDDALGGAVRPAAVPGYRWRVKCDVCKEREATVHDNAICAGKIAERHLCEGCAIKLGVAPQTDPSAVEIVSEMIAGEAQSAKRGGQVIGQCPTCGLAFGLFKAGGLLGCPECYYTFESQLGPMLERYHEGGARHTGKHPKRAGPGTPRPVPAAPQAGSPLESKAEPAPRPAADERAKRVAVLRGQ